MALSRSSLTPPTSRHIHDTHGIHGLHNLVDLHGHDLHGHDLTNVTDDSMDEAVIDGSEGVITSTPRRVIYAKRTNPSADPMFYANQICLFLSTCLKNIPAARVPVVTTTCTTTMSTTTTIIGKEHRSIINTFIQEMTRLRSLKDLKMIIDCFVLDEILCLLLISQDYALTFLELDILVEDRCKKGIKEVLDSLSRDSIEWFKGCRRVSDLMAIILRTYRGGAASNIKYLRDILEDIHAASVHRMESIRVRHDFFTSRSSASAELPRMVELASLVFSTIVAQTQPGGSLESPSIYHTQGRPLEQDDNYNLLSECSQLVTNLGYLYMMETESPIGFETNSMPIVACLGEGVPNVYIFTRDAYDSDIFITAHRNDIVSTSFEAVMRIPKEAWEECSSINITYYGETAYGEGVVRDWLCTLSEELFYNSKYFVRCVEDPSVVHPCSCTTDINYHSKWMEFAGRIIGFGLKFHIPIGVHLSDAAIRLMTSRGVGLNELSQLDPAIARSCSYIKLITKQAELIDLEQDFFNSIHGDELFPGSSMVPVTMYNKDSYANMLAIAYLQKSASSCTHMRNGMMDVLYNRDLYHKLLAGLNRVRTKDFNVLIGGMRSICADDWCTHTIVEGVGSEYVSRDDPTIVAFFNMVRGFDQVNRQKLLRFWTGLKSLPAGGFNSLEREVRLVLAPGLCMPHASTCTMTLRISNTLIGNISKMQDQFELALASISMDEFR